MKGLMLLLCGLLLVSCADVFVDNEADTIAVFEATWKEVDQHYAFFDQSDLDWDAVYSNYQIGLDTVITEMQLFKLISQMLNSLGDAHTNIYTPHGPGGNVSYFSYFKTNEIDSLEHYLEEIQVINRLYTFAKIKGASVYYLKIKSFDASREEVEAIAEVLEQIPAGESLIIDVRGNRGGLISNAALLLSYLISKEVTPLHYRFRNGDAHDTFTDWQPWQITPQSATYWKGAQIALLTSRHTYSACEWFVAGMMAMDEVITVGDHTGGGSGKPILRELPNGWLLRISSSQARLPIGADFQFAGIPPDVSVQITAAEAAANHDTVLERALEILR